MYNYSDSFKESAEYDLKTAENMLNDGRYIYVIFMCHLAIEKILKAIVAKETNKMPPKTHNLIYLIKLANLKIPQNLFDFITKINNASIVTRYPENFSELLKVYPKDVATDYFENAKEVIKCLLADKRLET
jgi:HEPN domain-containing protein